MNLRFPFHPLLLAAYPVLFLYLHNIGLAVPMDIPAPLSVCVVFVAAAWAAFYLIWRDVRKGALLAVVLFLFLFSYGHVFTLLQGMSAGSFVVGRTRVLLPAWMLAMALSLFLVARARAETLRGILTPIANAFSLIMVAMAVIQISLAHLQRAKAVSSREANAAAPAEKGAGAAAEPSQPARGALPDIYYLIPDSYESSASLKKVFGFDNSAFTGFLEEKGFFVASRSHSNYAFTGVSLPSSLNMELLSSLRDRLGRFSDDESPLGEMVRDSKVAAFLKNKGYTVINAGSWWGPTSGNRNADINYRSGVLNEFNIKLIETTVFHPFIEEFSEDDLRRKVLYTFDRLGEIPYIEEPTFTLAHVICPHPPFVFGPSGEKLSTVRRVIAKTNPKDLYRDQVIFVNGKIREAVEKILARSKVPPIIIIQGDHGAAYTRNSLGFSGILPDPAYLREQMSIMNAYYLPGTGKAALYDSITPVNSFRVVFNAYFGANLPLSADSSFYSSHLHPYDFVDVTDIVRAAD